MPSKNSLKVYVDNSFYHIYNRGVEKRVIFEDAQDYKVFLRYLKEILSPPDRLITNTIFTIRGQSYEAVNKPLKNYSHEIDLCAYCLMPNHFHLLVRQTAALSIMGFMRALMTRYSMYFNKRYNRVGSLFQGRYKASMVTTEPYLLHLSRYIHLNPRELNSNLETAYSSYMDYLGKKNTPWIKPEAILSYFDSSNLIDFKKVNSYQNFVENYNVDSYALLGDLTLE